MGVKTLHDLEFIKTCLHAYRQCLQVYAHMYAFPFIALLLSCLLCMKIHGTPMETNNFKKSQKQPNE